MAGNYLAHTQGKRHQQNIARRIAKDAYELQAVRAPCTLMPLLCALRDAPVPRPFNAAPRPRATACWLR